jgi:hypothetical protein
MIGKPKNIGENERRIGGGGQIDFQFCGDGELGREGANTISLISLCKKYDISLLIE